MIVVLAVHFNAQSPRSFEEAVGVQKLTGLCDAGRGIVFKKVLEEYGAFLVGKDVVMPPTCLFETPEEVNKFQGRLIADHEIVTVRICNKDYAFQKNAGLSIINILLPSLARIGIVAKDLPRRTTDNDREELTCGREIISLNKDWASRNFEKTSENWKHQRCKTLRPCPQVETTESIISGEISTNQYRGNFIESEGLNKPIMRSVAVPGASQHISLLAFDLNNNICNSQVIEKLAEAGWFRTVIDDDCHFTYLGWTNERDLRRAGLKRVKCTRNVSRVNARRESVVRSFWIPRITSFAFTEYANWGCEDEG